MNSRCSYIKSSKNVLFKMFFLLFILTANTFLFAQKPIILSDQKFPFSIGRDVSILVDKDEIYNSSNIVFQNNFQKSNKPVPVFSLPKNVVWLKIKLRNRSIVDNPYLSINYSDISSIKLYEKDKDNHLHLLKDAGNSIPFFKRENDDINFNFELELPKNSEKEYYINVNSSHPYEVPIFINNLDTISATSFKENVIIGFYCGIIISTLFYNLFLFFSTRDRNYLIYVGYLFVLCFAQITLAGWSFKFFWPAHPQINSYIVICSSCIVGFFAVFFSKYFLNTKYYTPRLDNVLSVLLALYAISTILSFTNYSWISYMAFNYLGLVQVILLLTISVIVYKAGNSSALFYLIAWSSLLLSFVVYLLKNLNIFPQNEFTHFSLYIGSAVEAVLLSFALANRINILRREKEQSQAESLRISKENERLILEQNIILEQKITERTYDLEKTLSELKDAQTQLVESEKMASLGQLTAGIAHEINNPINFVKSNVKPLQLDVQDLFSLINKYQQLHRPDLNGQSIALLSDIKSYENQIDLDFIKDEIGNLIGGIEEGAERTAEIVRGLRNFSRLDESELKTVNIYEGIDSTLILLRNIIPHYVKIIKHYDAEGNIECYPSKLNQVFMNVITNGIQAIKAKTATGDESITISTREIDRQMEITIKDTGIGMSDEVKHKIYDPFFTTKEVGEGTGLGMAIVFKIVEKHQGKITVVSSPGNGAEFILQIPYIQ